MLVLVLVLVLERCCLQKRRVNPIRSAFPELHPRSGLKVLTRRFVLVLPPSPSLRRGKLSSNPAARRVGPPASLREALRAGVMEYCAKSELRPRSG